MKSNLSWMGKRSLGSHCAEARITVRVHTHARGAWAWMLQWKKPSAMKE